ncbi:hypothetical protein KJ969_05540, partial [Patescibacteria group bacterium]|nr:hypothetical protein [Patescibacteria group bacterium]
MKKFVKSTFVKISICTLLLMGIYCVPTAMASVVQLDTTFNTVGYVIHDNAAGGSSTENVISSQIQSDGKYVVSGFSINLAGNMDMAIWRYNTDGTLDTTFNVVGYTVHDSAAGGSSHDSGVSLQIQSDGKYVVAGYSRTLAGDYDLAIWRYNTDGTLDTTFNVVGYATHDNAAGGSGSDWGRSLQIQSDGKYVVAGYSRNAAGNDDMVIWRYNTDGTLDATFNAVGYIIHDNAAGGSGNDTGQSLQIQSDGKYVVAGNSTNAAANTDMAIWRYNADGTLDTTFNTVGYATHDSAAGGSGAEVIYSLQIQSDGKYVVAGYSTNAAGNWDMAIWRYNTDGTLDTTFNTVGYAAHDSAAGGSGDDAGWSLYIQSDGKYVISGRSRNAAGDDDLAIWRYNTDGTLDTTFNTVGYLTHNGAAGGVGKDEGWYVRVQSDGKFVVAGRSRNAAGNDDMAIWRYETVAGITVNAIDSVTGEDGNTGSFSIVLDSRPTANVVINILSSDTSEGTASPSSLTFTSTNWSTPQTVTITGVDDALVDGDFTYNIVTAAAVSTDTLYNGLNPDDVSMINTDVV